MCSNMCLYVPEFRRQVFKHGKILSEQSKKMRDQKKDKVSVLVADSTYNAQNAQIGFLMLVLAFVLTPLICKFGKQYCVVEADLGYLICSQQALKSNFSIAAYISLLPIQIPFMCLRLYFVPKISRALLCSSEG